jgi:hypothetical protein
LKILWSCKDTDHNLAKPMHKLDGPIFTTAKVLIGIVGQNAISEHRHHRGCFLCVLNPSNPAAFLLRLKSRLFFSQVLTFFIKRDRRIWYQ